MVDDVKKTEQIETSENTEHSYRVLAATGIGNLDSDLTRIYNIDITLVGICSARENLIGMIDELDPEIVIVTDSLYGDVSLINVLIDAKKAYPDVRFIYFPGMVDTRREPARAAALGALVLAGIYDIRTGTVNPNIIADIIQYPMKREAVRHFTDKILDQQGEIRNAASGVIYESYEKIDEDENKRNCIVSAYSSKPGTGKTFVSANLALALALHGLNKPKVAYIEADLQTLSVGTVLGIPDDKQFNLYTCLEAVKELADNKTLDEEKQYRLKRHVKKCFIKYKNAPNLYVLSGSGILPDDIAKLKIKGNHYNKLLDIAVEDYDIIVMDLNSSAVHSTTYVSWMRSKQIYFVMNLDYNNVRNNLRYKKMFEKLGITSKIKYVLNQNVENTEEYKEFGIEKEELIFTAKDIEKKYFKLYKKIPNILFTVIQNANFYGRPIMLTNNSLTDKARLVILEMARDLWPMDKEINRLEKKFMKKKSIFDIFKKKKPENNTREPETEEEILIEEEFEEDASPEELKNIYEETLNNEK